MKKTSGTKKLIRSSKPKRCQTSRGDKRPQRNELGLEQRWRRVVGGLRAKAERGGDERKTCHFDESWFISAAPSADFQVPKSIWRKARQLRRQLVKYFNGLPPPLRTAKRQQGRCNHVKAQLSVASDLHLFPHFYLLKYFFLLSERCPSKFLKRHHGFPTNSRIRRQPFSKQTRWSPLPAAWEHFDGFFKSRAILCSATMEAKLSKCLSGKKWTDGAGR